MRGLGTAVGDIKAIRFPAPHWGPEGVFSFRTLRCFVSLTNVGRHPCPNYSEDSLLALKGLAGFRPPPTLRLVLHAPI